MKFFLKEYCYFFLTPAIEWVFHKHGSTKNKNKNYSLNFNFKALFLVPRWRRSSIFFNLIKKWFQFRKHIKSAKIQTAKLMDPCVSAAVVGFLLFCHFVILSPYHKGLSTLKKYHGDSIGLHEFFHHSAIISCIALYIWKSVDCYFLNKVYRDILRFLLVHRNSIFIEGRTLLTETIVLLIYRLICKTVQTTQALENIGENTPTELIWP